MTRLLTTIAALLTAASFAASQAPERSNVAPAFEAFLQASSSLRATGAIDSVVASGVSFDEAVKRLKQGRTYSREVARGVVQASYRGDGSEYYYTLDVPETYDPARKYQVRVQLHGGVLRIEQNTPPRPGSNGRMAGVEQIYVMPYAWRDAPWWSSRQTGNLRTIVDLVKRTYNVDENRVVLSGVSDGGTGVYYTALRETTPFASFLPLNGFILVLKNETVEADGDLFPHNLVNKPLFIVNGGRDPQYPTSMVDPYVARLKASGVDLVYKPQPNAAHDTSWWPEVKDVFEQFVADHPRRPLPDAISWESGAPNLPARAHWLVIDRLAPAGTDEPMLPDANRMATRPALDFGIRGTGNRINRVAKGSNAEQIGLRSGDVVLTLNNQPLAAGTDVAEALRGFPEGRPLILTVSRGADSVRLTGRFSPTLLPGEAEMMFPPQRASGRVDLARAGNRVEATTRGVGAFTLLLSPDQFDLNRAVTVVVNGKTVFEGVVKPDVKTLLKWAAHDNDRTMLFGAELPIEVR